MEIMYLHDNSNFFIVIAIVMGDHGDNDLRDPSKEQYFVMYDSPNAQRR